MAELLVIPSELERAAGRLQASADQVRSVVGGLLPAVALGGGALGDAALFDSFHTMWSRWAAELGGLADDLTGAATRLQAAAAEYRSTDQGAVPPPAGRAVGGPAPGRAAGGPRTRARNPRPGPGSPSRGARPSYAPLLWLGPRYAPLLWLGPRAALVGARGGGLVVVGSACQDPGDDRRASSA